MTAPSRRLPPWGVGVQATLALAAVAALGEVIGLHLWWGPATAGVAALCAVLAEANRKGGAVPARIAVQLTRCAMLGGWLGWAWARPDDGLARFAAALGADITSGTVLSLPALGTLAAGCQIGAHLGLLQPAKREPGTGMVLMSAHRATETWRRRISQRGGAPFTGVQVTEVTSWSNRAGEDVRVVLPAGGATADDLRRHLVGLGADANLPHGCTIELIEPQGEGQRTLVLRVPKVNQTSADEPHPCPVEQRSVLDPVEFGVHPNGDTASAPIRELSWLVVGKRGAGKTTLLHGLTAQIGMCSDALVWHLDLNGGGMTQPWVDAWIDGRVQRCPVDWAAPTVDEGIRMLRAAVAIAKHRKTAYRKRKKAHNTNLLPVGPDLPEIVIMLDEGAEALEAAGGRKTAELADLLAQIQRIARNEAVNLVLSALRGTGDIVPAGMTAQVGVGICMKVQYTKEIAAVFEQAWELKLKPSHLASVGAGWLGVDGGDPVRFQGWNILPDDMEQVALTVARVRPDLDEASARVAGQAYAERYERMRCLFLEADDGDSPADAEDALAPEGDLVLHGGGAPGSSAASWPDPGQVAQAPVGAATTRTAPVVPSLLLQVLRLAESAGQPRVATTWLIDELGLDMTPKAFGSLLAAWGAPVGRQQIGGREVRGPVVRDLKAAVARIEEGGPVDVTEGGG